MSRADDDQDPILSWFGDPIDVGEDSQVSLVPVRYDVSLFVDRGIVGRQQTRHVAFMVLLNLGCAVQMGKILPHGGLPQKLCGCQRSLERFLKQAEAA